MDACSAIEKMIKASFFLRIFLPASHLIDKRIVVEAEFRSLKMLA